MYFDTSERYFLPSEEYQSFSGSQNCINGNVQNEVFLENGFVHDSMALNDPNFSLYHQSSYQNGSISEIPDFPDACLKFLSDILMEEDLDGTPATLQDFHALEATERSLYDALGGDKEPAHDQWLSVGIRPENFDDLSRVCNGHNAYVAAIGDIPESNWLNNDRQLDTFCPNDDTYHPSECTSVTSGSSNGFDQLRDGPADSPISTLFDNESRYTGSDDLLREAYKFIAKSNYNGDSKGTKQKLNGKIHGVVKEGAKGEGFVNGSRGRKNYQRESINHIEERSTKQIASSNEEYVEMKDFDEIFICEEGKDDISPYTRKNSLSEAEEKQLQIENAKGSKSRRRSLRGKKKTTKGEVVDLRNLLIQCAQAVTSFELTNANDLLKQIRQHASQHGDSSQRVAHYFAEGLEARLAGTGSEQYREFVGKPISSAETLKGYELYVRAVPFQRTTYYIANQMIAKLASKATKIHIIDFGIYFGFQWPGLIQLLSRRRVGPPRLRITGVDFPASGFKPAQKIEETGQRLAGYCERFGVPFEFQAIAQRWHTLKPEDFKIERDELVIITCLYQSKKLPDESADADSPRDRFLRMIRSLNPDLFIHGVVNGTFNAPFFITRFREALYHYSALFDVFEATMPREAEERLLIEQYLYGKDAMNIVACEGSERIERPESYKQWQVRHLRSCFMQVPLDQEVLSRGRAMVKANYHKDFMLEQDRHWMVQGWKGRIVSAVSCWKSA